MTTITHSIKRARDLFAVLDREHPEPVRGLPGSLTILMNSEGSELRVERWFELHGHNEGPRRFVVARPAERGGGNYVVELDGPDFQSSGWTGRVETAGQVHIGMPTVIRRAAGEARDVVRAAPKGALVLVLVGILAVAVLR